VSHTAVYFLIFFREICDVVMFKVKRAVITHLSNMSAVKSVGRVCFGTYNHGIA